MRRLRKSAALLALAGGIVATASSAQSTPSDHSYATRYDSARRIVGTIAPDPDGTGPLRFPALRNSFDVAGRLVLVEKGELRDWQSEKVAPANWSGFSVFASITTKYDAMGRKTMEGVREGDFNAPAQTLTQSSYNRQGLLECIAVRMNPAIFNALPPSACTLGDAGNSGPDRITRHEYDAAGQLLRVYKAYGTPLQQVYVAYEYSLNGKQRSVTDANGNRAEMRYDGYDRQSAWYFPSKTTAGVASSDDYEAYEYDANGNRTSLRKRDGSQLTFEYDALNRMTVKRVPKGCGPNRIGGCPDSTATNDVYYGYDLRGLQTYARFGSHQGEGVINVYDGFGHLIKTTTAMARTSRVVSAEYDGNGNRTELKTPGGTWTYAYDGLDRMNGLYEGVGTSTVMSTWTYNAQGLPQAVVERSGSGATWGYDGSGRLTSQNDTFAGGTGNVGVTLDYNPASQIVSRTRNNQDYAFAGKYEVSRKYEKNGLNQYTTAGPATFSYDVNGNLIADGKTTYIYDAENRLVKAGETSLTYDPLGRLFQVSGSSGSTQFLYDGDQLVAEYDGAGSLTNAYVHGPGEDDPLLWYPAGEAARWYHRDHRGSIVATATGPSGTLAGINTYDEYGIPGTGNRGRFQYTGQAFIPELGMYHYKARVYSPTLGRFLQTDPIGYDDQVNLYAYVANDPVNRTDPTGLCGYRYDDGSCQVKVDPKTGADGIAAGKALEGRLNAYDKTVNALDPKSKIAVTNDAGKTIGSTTGAKLQKAWNNQKFSVTSKNFGNGGLGATKPGRTDLNPQAVSAYTQGALARGRTVEAGRDTLIFHEFGHAFKPGSDVARSNPVAGGQPNTAAESAASAQGRAISNSVGGSFMCELPGPYGC